MRNPTTSQMIGTRLAHYEITTHLGSGGMGDVYQARDTRLGRNVAIKFLPSAFGDDVERVARFRREARVLASLNHPNIAAIYGFDEIEGRHLLVMELAAGETLEERTRRGALPVEEALPIAKQIADALEEAHEAGIVHRDLKPANIKLTAGDKVKVLDFGLAKAYQVDQADQADASASTSPTITMSQTGGAILGTPAYMAPEQARGKPVDRRADIWAFGVVLFRMLAGSRVFEGETVSDTLVNVLEREPNWSQLPPQTPPPVRTLLQRCLTKNPKNRLQAIGDARITLEELIEHRERSEPAPATPRMRLWQRVLPWALAPVCLTAGVWLNSPDRPPDQPMLQFDFPLPANQVLSHVYRNAVALSADGRQIAYVAGSVGGGDRRIYVRKLDVATETLVPDSDGAQSVFFSPDGNWVGFQQGQQIKKVSLAGAAPAVIVENLNLPLATWGPPGIVWGRNGTIVFPYTLGSGLSAVRDTGGKPEDLTTLDPANNEVSHRLPHFLPDGSGVLFTVLRYTAVTPDWSRAQVWAKSLKNGERKLLLNNALDAQYAGENTLVFARQGKLFAIRFDPSSMSVSGKEVQVLDGVTHAMHGTAAITWTGAAQFSVADSGTLVYAPGSTEPPNVSSLIWFDRQGRTTPITNMRGMSRFAPRVLPDGIRIASSELYANKDIWVFDTARGTEDRITYEGQNAFPIWTADGSRFAFRSDRAGPQQIYVSDAANPTSAKPLTSGPFDVPSAWTPDGKELLFTRGFTSLGGNTDIYAVSIDRPDKPRAVIATSAEERFPELSRDGKWLAYVSNDTGQPQLYVQPYPEPGARVTITSGGAQDPAWSKNSNELFYAAVPGPARMMTVPFTVSDGSFVPGKPVELFRPPTLGSGTTVRGTYDVAPDGRFLLNQIAPEVTQERNRRIFPSTLRIVLNWTHAVQRLLSSQ